MSEYMEKIYKKQFNFIRDNNIVENKTKIEDNYGRVSLVTFVNPFYGWFGNNGNQINIKDIRKIIND